MGGSSVRSIRINEPSSLVISLYVRDAYRIPAEAGVPQLSPSVPAAPAVRAVTPDVAGQWQQWWDQLLDYEGTLRAGAGPRTSCGTRPGPKMDESRYPELAELVQVVWEPAARYADQRAREAADLFRRVGPASPGAIEREFLVKRRIFSRRNQPADVGVTVIPADGALAKLQSRCHLLISRRSYADRNSYRAILENALR